MLTNTSLDPMCPPLSFPVLHSILEDFLPPYYHSIQLKVVTALITAANIFRLSAVTQKPYKLFADTVLLFKGAEYKFDNSEVPLFMNTTCSKYFRVSIFASPILFVDSCTCTSGLSVLSHNKARPGCICQSIPFFCLCQIFNTRNRAVRCY